MKQCMYVKQCVWSSVYEAVYVKPPHHLLSCWPHVCTGSERQTNVDGERGHSISVVRARGRQVPTE